MPTTVGPNNSRMSKTNSMDAKLRSYAGQNRDASNNRGPNIDGVTRNRRDVDGSRIPAKEKTLTTAGMLKTAGTYTTAGRQVGWST